MRLGHRLAAVSLVVLLAGGALASCGGSGADSRDEPALDLLVPSGTPAPDVPALTAGAETGKPSATVSPASPAAVLASESVPPATASETGPLVTVPAAAIPGGGVPMKHLPSQVVLPRSVGSQAGHTPSSPRAGIFYLQVAGSLDELRSWLTGAYPVENGWDVRFRDVTLGKATGWRFEAFHPGHPDGMITVTFETYPPVKDRPLTVQVQYLLAQPVAGDLGEDAREDRSPAVVGQPD